MRTTKHCRNLTILRKCSEGQPYAIVVQFALSRGDGKPENLISTIFLIALPSPRLRKNGKTFYKNIRILNSYSSWKKVKHPPIRKNHFGKC